MIRHRRCHTLVPVGVILAVFALVPATHAGLGDALKKKLNEKATKKAESAIDKAAGDAAPAASQPAGEPSDKEADAGGATKGAGAGGGTVATVSTRFDFVPGDSVLFLDDFTQDELGEFPARWRLTQGTFEVAEMSGERWLRCTSPDGRVRMKLPTGQALPEFWTLELDFFGIEPLGSALTVIALTAEGNTVWEATWPHGNGLAFRSGDVFSTTPLEGAPVGGRHRVMFMARGRAIKAYMDRQRLANVPEYSGSAPPASVEIRLWANTRPMITNVRFAEGCRPAKDMLAEGRLVTYGIHFETGSDVVLPESAPILRQIAAYLEANPAVKLRITGHTDNVGSAPGNLDLSRRRAASVARVLAGQFAIAADRLATDGRGDTQAVASNAKPEGRAMNRRVEFAKI